MDHYYVNKNPQSTGEHEVHKKGCSHFPEEVVDLGFHSDCSGAVKKAREFFSNVDGCYWCARPCHTR